MSGARLALVLAVLLAGAIPLYLDSGAADEPRVVAHEKSCVECHRERQPLMIRQWELGAHAKKGVACEECHGEDHDAMFDAKGLVPSDACARCHEQATREFKASVHGRARGDALKNARLLMQIPAMQRQGCLGCHDTGGKDGGRCDGCHFAHRFSAAEARRPEACGMCHNGPDHPQIEAWELSKHGVVYLDTHDRQQGPICVDCHMPDGTHDVSTGITIGRAAHGAILEGDPDPPIPMRRFSPEYVAEQRELMLQRCDPCHTRRVARTALEDCDAIKREADRLMGEAVAIMEGLLRDGLLDPMPDQRIANPTKGHALVLGGAQLYELGSDPERIFFDLAKFAHSITFKGAYHFSPDHTHWQGMARLKAGLEALRAQERRLRGQ